MAGIGTFCELSLEVPHGTDDEEIAAAVSLAAASDVAVVVVGTTAEVESEGFDRTSLALPGRQDELVRRVAAANPRTVVVVNSGAPVLMPWTEEVAAVLLTWFGGQEFGHALADVLLGDAEPGGRLPTTWPASGAGVLSTQPADGVLAATTVTAGRRSTRSVTAPATPPGPTTRSPWTATFLALAAGCGWRSACRCATPGCGAAGRSSRCTRPGRTRRWNAR